MKFSIEEIRVSPSNRTGTAVSTGEREAPGASSCNNFTQIAEIHMPNINRTRQSDGLLSLQKNCKSGDAGPRQSGGPRRGASLSASCTGAGCIVQGSPTSAPKLGNRHNKIGNRADQNWPNEVLPGFVVCSLTDAHKNSQ